VLPAWLWPLLSPPRPDPLAPISQLSGSSPGASGAPGVLSMGFVTAELNLQLSPVRWLRARVSLGVFIHLTKT